MSQPNLLELEAPIKICGAFTAPPGGLQQRGGSRPGLSLRPESPAQAISTGSTPTCCGCSSTGASRRRRTTSSWGTTLTEASRAWRQSASCSRTRCGPARAPGQAGARRAGAPHACGSGGRASARREQPASGRAGSARAALQRACPLAGGLALAASQSSSVRARASCACAARLQASGRLERAGRSAASSDLFEQAARGGESRACGAVARARPRRRTTGRWGPAACAMAPGRLRQAGGGNVVVRSACRAGMSSQRSSLRSGSGVASQEQAGPDSRRRARDPQGVAGQRPLIWEASMAVAAFTWWGGAAWAWGAAQRCWLCCRWAREGSCSSGEARSRQQAAQRGARWRSPSGA